MTTWKTPGGFADRNISAMLENNHLLIAGVTGAGKSVLMNTLIYTALLYSPARLKMIMIDPKRVDMIEWSDIPHLIKRAAEPADIVTTLNYCISEMETRYKYMERKRIKQFDSCHLYIFIDEFADLMTTQKRETLPQLQRLAQLGRAANIHLILATQRPTADIISGQIKANMAYRIALRCATAQESRNIIDRKCAETLPQYGYGYYLTPTGCDLVKIPKISDNELTARRRWWEEQKPKPRRRWW